MSEKIVRLRGRPRNFCESEALDRATQVFWAKGYDGATVDDLVAGTGVSRPSLYATFGDKKALFMRCLAHYGLSVGAPAMQALHAAPSIQEAVRGFLRQAVEGNTGESTPRGCLMACVVPSVSDPEVQEFSARAMAHMAEVIESRLREGVARGELPPEFPCPVRSRQIMGASFALALQARAGATRETLLADADDTATLLLGRSSETD